MNEETNGQVALEYLIVTAFLLIASSIIFIYSSSTLDQNLRYAITDQALVDLASAAEKVSSRGPNNTVFVEIRLPNDVQSNQIDITKNTIQVTLIIPSGINQRHVTTSAILTPTTISTTNRIQIIKVEMIDANVVFMGV